MGFSHIDEDGNAVMVDVTEKNVTNRKAVARGRIRMNEACFAAIKNGEVKKGDVLAVARVAGIMAAKRTASLIPLCHGLNLAGSKIDFSFYGETREIEARCAVRCKGQTGVEMEALTGVSVALLTIYDMCKAIDKSMVIGQIHLLEKEGGKSGPFLFTPEGGPS